MAQPAISTPPPQWTVVGRCFDTGSKAVSPANITLPATDVCIPNLPNSSGKPISKALAELFVSNLMSLFTTHLNYQIPQAATVDELSTEILALQGFIKLLYNASHGVTFDKDLILKILSQPKAEGVRCYVCAKGPNNAPGDLTNCDLSLVVVGVDVNGNDLNWPSLAPPATLPTKIMNVILPLVDDGSSPSLAGEYGTPPPPDEQGGNLKTQSYTIFNNAISFLK